MIVNSYFLFVLFVMMVICVCHIFCFADVGLFTDCVFMVHLTYFGWSFLSSAFFGAGFVDRYCLKLILLLNILFSLSIME